MIDDSTRIEIAKSLGWDVEKEMQKFLENDKCNCGHDISFINSKEDAKAFIIHMIQAFESGLNTKLQNPGKNLFNEEKELDSRKP